MSKTRFLKIALFCCFALFELNISAKAQTTYSGTLPVLFIETEGHAPINSKDTYLSATYRLDPMGQSGVEAFGTVEKPLPLQIKGRGNWTWTGFEKKPYRLKLDTKAALLGMNKSKHFALLAHADDNKGFLRNTIGFRLSEMLGLAWTPKQQPVEVVLNGEYIGLYFLTETIRVDKDRVNIVEQADLVTNPDSITGGWLVEIDNYDNDPHIEITEGDGSRIIITYSTPEILSTEQQRFLTDEMERINRLVYGDKSSDELWNYVDIDALARFYIVQELTDNYESFHGSCYLHRNLGNGQKWVFGPVWDFGSAFNYDKTQYAWQGREHHMTWIGEICRFPRFMDTVQSVWHDFLQNGFEDIYTYTDSFARLISEAARSDARRWPAYGNSDTMERAARVRARLQGSVWWLGKQWGTADQQTWTVWFRDNGNPLWNEVYCYIWDGNAIGHEGSNYEPLKSWPGTPMNTVQKDGLYYHTLQFTPEYPLSSSAGIIFNNGSSGKPDNQTDDFRLQDNTIYNRQGIIGTVTALEDLPRTAPSEQATLQARKVLLNGNLRIILPDGSVYTPDGLRLR